MFQNNVKHENYLICLQKVCMT